MSAHQAPALDAVTFQLVAALERYEQDVASMADTWLDMGLYSDVGDQIERIRMYSKALPQLSVHWGELLIAHAELVHTLWRLRFHEDAADRGKLQEAQARHAASVASLKSRCVRLLARGVENSAS